MSQQPDDPRYLRALELARQGKSMRKIGAELGVSHEAVRIWLKKVGFGSEQIRQVRQEVRERKRHAAMQQRVQELREQGALEPKDCVVCGKSISVERMILARTRNPLKTCSHECSVAWTHLRYRTKDGWERHRRSHARSILKNPSKHPAASALWAKRVLDGIDAPTRKSWFVKSNKPLEYAKKYDWQTDGSLVDR